MNIAILEEERVVINKNNLKISLLCSKDIEKEPQTFKVEFGDGTIHIIEFTQNNSCVLNRLVMPMKEVYRLFKQNLNYEIDFNKLMNKLMLASIEAKQYRQLVATCLNEAEVDGIHINYNPGIFKYKSETFEYFKSSKFLIFYYKPESIMYKFTLGVKGAKWDSFQKGVFKKLIECHRDTKKCKCVYPFIKEQQGIKTCKKCNKVILQV